jgi:hypothetical protein
LDSLITGRDSKSTIRCANLTGSSRYKKLATWI